MKTPQSFRNTAWLLCIASVIGLWGCGGGGGGANPVDPIVVPAAVVPAAVVPPVVVPPVVVPPVVVPPVVNVNPPNPGPGITLTVAFVTPGADAAIPSDFNARVDVTGSPDKVEFYVNGILKGAMDSPTTPAGPEYYFYWTASSEPEGTYILTAKATKAGSSDVTSAPRTIIVDRTFPTLVSRTPADGARNVLSTDEISITMSEPMMANSIDFNSVKLLKNGVDVDSIATLDSTGKKISVRFKNSQLYPATLTMVVNGIKDLAGKGASIPNATFGVVDQIITGPPKVNLTLSKYAFFTSGATTARITLQNFSSSMPLSPTIFMQLVTNGRILDTNPSSLAQGPVDCPEGYCRLSTFYLNSNQNGTHPIKARVFLADGTIIESNVVTLSVDIENRSFDFPAGWTPFPNNIGSVLAAPTPQAYIDYEAPGNGRDKSGFPPNIKMRSHQQVFDAARNVEAGIAVYNRTFNISSVDNEVGAAGIYVFSFAFDNTPYNNDTVTTKARACRFVNDCTVWNYRNATLKGESYQRGELRLVAPRMDGTGYIEVEVTFDSGQRNSNFLVFNVDFSLYKQ